MTVLSASRDRSHPSPKLACPDQARRLAGDPVGAKAAKLWEEDRLAGMCGGRLPARGSR
jgi:hypothetical protein